MQASKKLLGGLTFVSRTFEGQFKENPYVLDMDANLYIGPADHLSRDEHSAIEVVFHFLLQTGRITTGLKDILRDRSRLLDAFISFDEARMEGESEEFRVFIFGTYDGELLVPVADDEFPAGPCGRSVNELKRRFYKLCSRLDAQFEQRQLSAAQIDCEKHFMSGSG